MTSREPMWFCYECNAEMRPLMAPDPHCASCNGTFVEKMDNPEDDPREFAHTHDNEDAIPPGFSELNPMIAGLSQLFNNAQRSTTAGTRSQPSSPRSSSSPPVGGNTTRSNFRFEISSGSGGNSRTFIFGGPNTLGTPGSPRPGLQEMPSFMRRSTGPGSPGTPGDISGPMMAQYLLALLGGMGNRRGHDGDDPFAAMFGAMGSDNGRWGDYAFSQEALDQIITEIMENSNAHRPVPASEDIMDKLPRTILEEGSPLLEKDCAVCKEQFALGSEDPDEQIVIDLPCKHPFHQGCILPWLKSSGTCPVCRYALVEQPDATGDHNRNTSDRQSSTSATPPSNTAGSSSGDNTSGAENGGILSQLMGYIRGSQPNGSGSQSTSRGHDGDGNSVPGGWDEQVD